MRVVFGLGNYGRRYADNRHNVGHMIIDKIAERKGVTLKPSILLSARIGEFAEIETKAALVKNRTFMNTSGLCAKKIYKRYGCLAKDVLFIHDDADLALGVLRFKNNGSSAGHRGIDSIIKSLETNEFNRLRIGIGRSGGKDLADFVLSDFEIPEKEDLDFVIDKACKACLEWIREGIESVMQKYNTRGGGNSE